MEYNTFKPFDSATLAALDIAHSDIRVVRGKTPPAKSWIPDHAPEPPFEVVFRKPTTGEADAFEGAAHNDKAKAGALRNLAKATIVGVSFGGKTVTCSDRKDVASLKTVREAWDDLRVAFPSVHGAASEDLMEMSGQAKDEGGKD